MGITNISVEKNGIQYTIRFDSTTLIGEVDSIELDYGQDSNYGNQAFGQFEDPGPPIHCIVVFNGDDPLVTEPFHFKCMVNKFVGPPDASDDQVYPPAVEPEEQPDRIIPIGGFAPIGSNDIIPGSTAISPYSNSPRFISAEEFMNNILR